MVVSGMYGPAIWQTPLAALVNLPGPLSSVATLTVRDLWIYIILSTFFIAHLPSCVVNVIRARRSRNEPVLPVFLEWTPMLIYTAATAAWFSSPWTYLLKENRVVLFCLTQSFVFGRMTTKIILAHLTKQAFPYWTVLMVPLVGGALLSNLPRLGFQPVSAGFELAYLRAYFVFAVVVYFRWALLVIKSICRYLGINCLTIPMEKQRALAAAAAKGRVQ